MRICIYGASSPDLLPDYYSDAEELGRLIAEGGHELIFGGGKNGLMGACAMGAYNAGGKLLGIAPKFFDQPGILVHDESEFIFTETLSERKSLMIETADAFIALPGGIGTFEEFFETLTLKQLGIHGKPMALVNTLDYYRSFSELLYEASEKSFMSRKCLKLFKLCSTPADALDYVMSCEELRGDLSRLADYTK